MAHIVVAHPDDGRRSLLASGLERAGFKITRASTLERCFAAASGGADVILIDDQWGMGDPFGTIAGIRSLPPPAGRTRVVMLAPNDGETQRSAYASGVSEVVVKPVDFGALTDRLHAHARGDFVATPSFAGPSGPSTTATAPTTVADDWSVPLMTRILEQQAQRGEDVGSRILELAAAEGMTLDVPPEQVEMLLRLAVDALGGGDPVEVVEEVSVESINRSSQLGGSADPIQQRQGPSLGSNIGAMEMALDRQAEAIATEVERTMDAILDERPEPVSFVPEDSKARIDPEVLEMTRLTVDLVHELMWSLGRPGAVEDLSLLTRIEDATEMLGSVLDALPQDDDDSEGEDGSRNA